MSNENSKFTAEERLKLLFDQNTFKEIGKTVSSYGKPSGVTTAFGTIDDTPVYAFSQDSSISSGAIDKAHSLKIKKLYSLAVKTGSPIVGIYDSLGGNLREGVAVMNAYSDIISTISKVSGVVPQISIILGNCGGAIAMAACSSDIIISDKKSEIFMTAPFKNNSERSAQVSYDNGIISNLCEDEQTAIQTAKEIISYFPKNNLEQAPIFEFTENNVLPLPDNFTNCLETSSYAVDYQSKTILYGGYGKNCETSLATLGGVSIGIMSISGKMGYQECSKSARLANLCDCFNLPLITIMDCEGFDFDKNCESSAPREIAKLSHIMNDSTNAKVFLVTGKAYGTAYITFGGSADIKLAFPSAIISPLMPETASAILADDKITTEKNRKQVLDEFIKENLNAEKLAQDGIIDDIILPSNVRAELIDSVAMLYDKHVSRIPKKHSNIPM